MRDPYAAVQEAVSPARRLLDTLVGIGVTVTFTLSVLALALAAEPAPEAPTTWPATLNAVRCGGGR